MSSKIEASGSKLDGLKWLVVVALVAVGVVGNSFYADQSLLYRVVALLLIAGVAGFVAFQTARGAAFVTHMKEAKKRNS